MMIQKYSAKAKKIVFICACMFLASCATNVIVRPPPESVRVKQNQVILMAINKVARHGDWLVTRGYKNSDHFVAAITNTPLSHAAIIDKENNQVIEADAHGVYATNLIDFINKSHRVILIRPIWSNNKTMHAAVNKSRSLIGKKYDFLGTIGLNDPEKYYCSELTVYAYSDFHRPYDKLPRVIEPGQLYLWGQVLYDSRPRHENTM